MLKINVRTIPHDAQRYPTTGDYWEDEDGTLQVRLSDLGDRRLEFLVAIHELLEFELCRMRGISEETITRFDLKFEEEIAAGLRDEDDEPGEDPEAPYRREHAFAEKIERLIAKEMGVSWRDYERRLGALYEEA